MCGLSLGLLGEGGCAHVGVLGPLVIISSVHIVLYVVVGHICCATLCGNILC